jgi:hypothetical protein
MSIPLFRARNVISSFVGRGYFRKGQGYIRELQKVFAPGHCDLRRLRGFSSPPFTSMDTSFPVIAVLIFIHAPIEFPPRDLLCDFMYIFIVGLILNYPYICLQDGNERLLVLVWKDENDHEHSEEVTLVSSTDVVVRTKAVMLSMWTILDSSFCEKKRMRKKC